MLKNGQTYQESRCFSQTEVDRFSTITGDYNYLHSSDSESYDRFTGPIVHGAFIMGEFSRILGTVFPGPGTIYQSQDLKYYAPLYVGSEAIFSVNVVETSRPGHAIITTVCTSNENIICKGQASVIYKYITQDDIVSGLLGIGMKSGDVVLVHSSFKSFGPVLGGPQVVIKALQETVGKNGTVIMPTFNFDFANGIAYNYKTTVSKMGIITEIARNMPTFSKVHHPMYSFSISGAKSDEFGQINNTSAYGGDSVFAKLINENGKILILGLSYNDSMTFFHHVEEMVGCDYRYMKEFTGDIVLDNGDINSKTYSMYVRDINSGVKTMVNPMGKRLEELGLVNKINIGRCNVKLMKAREVFDATKDIPNNEPHLLREII